jgi:hypothetical protein
MRGLDEREVLVIKIALIKKPSDRGRFNDRREIFISNAPVSTCTPSGCTSSGQVSSRDDGRALPNNQEPQRIDHRAMPIPAQPKCLL